MMQTACSMTVTPPNATELGNRLGAIGINMTMTTALGSVQYPQ